VSRQREIEQTADIAAWSLIPFCMILLIQAS
jgi:hypothetical protein